MKEFLECLASNATRAFSAKRDGGAPKRANNASDSSGFVEPKPPPPEQVEWFRLATLDFTTSSLQSFGGHMEERIVKGEAQLRKELKEGNEQVAASMEKTLFSLDEKFTKICDKQREEMTSAKAECAQLKSLVESVSAAGPPPSRAHGNMPQGDIPVGERTVATLGALGWNTSAEELEDRARKILHDAGVTEFSKLTAMTGRTGGSTCHIIFNSPLKITEARVAVRAVKRHFTEFDDGKPRFVWCDTTKSRAELKPTRVMRNVHDLIVKFEKKEGRIGDIKLNPIQRIIEVNSLVIGYGAMSGWIWCPDGVSRYGEAEQAMATAI